MEYRFELALCAHLERATNWIVARQLGASVVEPGRRVMDVVGVVPGPAFDDRAQITSETIPPAVVESDLGPGRARDPADAVDAHPDRRAELIDRGVERGVLAVERRDGRRLVRQTARYPDRWVGEVVGIENKPDLGTPGALESQLRLDSRLAVFDRCVVATASHVTGAHRNRIPEEIGIWRFDPETGERTVIREPRQLSVEEPGIEIREQRRDRTDVAIVGAEAKARQRTRIAERAYGKGWRPALPACGQCEPTDDGRPRCAYFDRVIQPARECGQACPGHEPADPPPADLDALRAERTPWRRDPAGGVRRQTGLDRFG